MFELLLCTKVINKTRHSKENTTGITPTEQNNIWRRNRIYDMGQEVWRGDEAHPWPYVSPPNASGTATGFKQQSLEN
jgi:hypothetical protein